MVHAASDKLHSAGVLHNDMSNSNMSVVRSTLEGEGARKEALVVPFDFGMATAVWPRTIKVPWPANSDSEGKEERTLNDLLNDGPATFRKRYKRHATAAYHEVLVTVTRAIASRFRAFVVFNENSYEWRAYARCVLAATYVKNGGANGTIDGDPTGDHMRRGAKEVRTGDHLYGAVVIAMHVIAKLAPTMNPGEVELPLRVRAAAELALLATPQWKAAEEAVVRFICNAVHHVGYPIPADETAVFVEAEGGWPKITVADVKSAIAAFLDAGNHSDAWVMEGALRRMSACNHRVHTYVCPGEGKGDYAAMVLKRAKDDYDAMFKEEKEQDSIRLYVPAYVGGVEGTQGSWVLWEVRRIFDRRKKNFSPKITCHHFVDLPTKDLKIADEVKKSLDAERVVVLYNLNNVEPPEPPMVGALFLHAPLGGTGSSNNDGGFAGAQSRSAGGSGVGPVAAPPGGDNQAIPLLRLLCKEMKLEGTLVEHAEDIDVKRVATWVVADSVAALVGNSVKNTMDEGHGAKSHDQVKQRADQILRNMERTHSGAVDLLNKIGCYGGIQ